MASVSGGDRKLKPCSSKDPELSLSWCLSKLPKKSHCTKDLDKRAKMAQWRALLAIRTYHIKGHRSSISRFRREGGLELLLELLKQPDCSRKTLDLALSILGNCCTERETLRIELSLSCFLVAVDIMRRQVALMSIQNRAARVLGNLATDPESSALIHAAGGVPLLLLCVSQSSSSPPSSSSSPPSSSTSPGSFSPSPPSTPDSTTTTSTFTSTSTTASTYSTASDSSPGFECAQSAARALLYLCDTPAHRLSLLLQGAFTSLAPLLSPDLPFGLRHSALRALHELTRGCGLECARQVVRSGVLPQLGALASKDKEEEVEEEEEKTMEELALKTLANVCAQGCLRPLVGSLGVIRRFCEEVKKDALKSSVFFKALCLCCKEAVNRAKVKDCGGLELITGFITTHQDHPLSRMAIWACVDFVFDEVAMETLQEAGLVAALVEWLVRLCKGSQLPHGDVARDCMDSFDFPPPEEKKEALCSNSFLSLRSWLLSEGLISSEGDLLDSSSTGESEWNGLHLSSAPPPISTATAAATATTTTPITPATTAPTSSTSLKPPLLSPISSSTPNTQDPTCKNPSSSSSPVPSSPKTPVSPSKFKLGSPQRRKERDRGSILKFPIETPPSVTRPASYHPYHPEPWTPESPILLLLSRFSHVSDPSAVLVNSTVMSGLLLYLTSHPDPSARCFRLLLRLSENPNCLQALVRSGAAAMMHYQLCRRGVEGQGTRGEEEDKEKDEQRQSAHVREKVRQLGQSLLSNLQLQSEGAFGAGVLSHLLLTGSESDRLHSALCLPLLTSNKALLKKLLLDGGGLQFALQPLGGDTEDDSPKCPLLYLPLLAGCLTALTSGLNPSSQSSFSQTNLDFAQISSPPIKKPRLAPPSCPYLTATFDLSFLLDSGETLSANRNAVSGEDSSSEYFQALLNGGFDEASSKDAIPIRDINAAMLAPTLHHLHGCRFIATAIDKCHTLDSLVSSEMSENDKRFEETDLGRAMIGACRFLVTDLQKELEEVCIGLLTSGLDHLEKDKSEISHSEINASPDSKPQKRKCTNKTSPNRQADSWILNRLPQMYWFSQRYSYSNLGRACLSVLMVAPFSQAQVAEGLRSLVQEADCVQTLKMDLVRLVTEVLSCKG
ncbi:hypothetical protein NQD34_005966 [Periophthalmus magnuspinnatus]|nr:hypothetical protein NQD34_005966 [Periophthalmus magnuspinnatus]